MKPYYEKDGVTLYLGDCTEITVNLPEPDVLVTDPPFGIRYMSCHEGVLPRSIKGDTNTDLRDAVSLYYAALPQVIFGSWKAPRPRGTRMVLVWDTLGANGMGALDLPWKPAHQEIYIIGKGFTGPRTSDVLCFAPVQSMACNGRTHPHEKPVALLKELIGKCPDGTVIDPFCGTGSTLIAARELGRHAVGIEIEERYCEIAARRLDQALLPFGEPA